MFLSLKNYIDKPPNSMLRIIQNQSLRKYNTFGVNAVTAYFAEPQTSIALLEVMNFAAKNNMAHLIIGEGSNLLFTGNFQGITIHPKFEDIHVSEESKTEVLIQAGAGVNWDAFVEYCVSKNWFGTENLSLIPGSVGAAPVQNIGAYGVEAKDIIKDVLVYDTSTDRILKLSNAECEFGYRDSIFKNEKKGKNIVIAVIFRLQKNGEFKHGYGNVKDMFLEKPEQNIRELRNTIIEIRESKLPDPEKTGNAGSFFKNPVVDETLFLKIKKRFDLVPGYPASQSKIKIPAAWLIETAGWKGIRKGNAGTWPLQPLVIVNYENASGKEIFQFSEEIRKSVYQIFEIQLEREVTIIP